MSVKRADVYTESLASYGRESLIPARDSLRHPLSRSRTMPGPRRVPPIALVSTRTTAGDIPERASTVRQRAARKALTRHAIVRPVHPEMRSCRGLLEERQPMRQLPAPL